MQLAVCYARVSTQDQAEHGVSLDAQVDRLQSYCAAMNLKPLRIIREEGVSAGKPLNLRPGGQQALQLLATGKVNHLVAMKLDRLFRSTDDALKHTTEWDAQGIVLHLCDMGGQNLNTSSAIGRMMLTLLASFAEFERNLISERTCSALAHKKRKREAYNHTPYGFQVDGKKLVPHEAEQKVIQLIFEWRKDGMSLYAIATRLNDLGVATKKKKRWHAATISHIVNNDLYREAAPDNLINIEHYRDTPSAEEVFTDQLIGVVHDLSDDTV